jgi:histidine ammonia-lyase
MIVLDRHDALDLETYRRIVVEYEEVALATDALRLVDERRAAMLRAIESGMPAYGVTTGLGYLATRTIPEDERLALQRAILLGRAVAVGPPLDPEVVRGTMLLRLTGFLSGTVGVGSELCRFIADRLNDGWTPFVPARPHGAAGEVSQLAHLFETFVGEGFVLEDGEQVPAAAALTARGVAPYEPGLKEGIALVNGAPLAPALTAPLVRRGRALVEHATLAAALAAAVTGASARPYSVRLGRLQVDEAVLAVDERLSELLGAAALADRPQAPVSLRVTAQVHGAVAGVLDTAEQSLERALRAVSDSPLFLAASDGEPEGFYPSGGFHAQALAFALDLLAIAFTQLANLAEKRLHRLLDARFSQLPEQLAVEPGRHTGVSVLHKAVAALCAENRLLAAPASVTAFDTSAGQEDFQAFVPLAAEKLDRVLANVELALAYELTSLAQAVWLGARELTPELTRAAALLRDAVPRVVDDRPLAPDVERVLAIVRSGELLA